MERKYLFSFIYDYKDCLFRDVMESDSKLEYLPSHKVFNNKAIDFCEKIALSYNVNSRFEFPFQHVFYNIENYNYKADTEYFLIIPNSSICKFTTKYLEAFKKRHHNVKLVAFLVDSIHGNSIQMNLVRDKLVSSAWDHILTYDKYDAEEFGYKWIGYTYYSAHMDAEPSSDRCDLYCVSSPKGRDGLYRDIYKKMRNKNVNCNFRLFTQTKDNYLPGTDLEYMHKYMIYDDVIGEVKSSNCILEVLQPNQRMQTIRYFESVVHNKKLLTNNPDLEELPYYDSRYMKYFKDADDIDSEWVKKKEMIDYEYKGDFSPRMLIPLLNSL